MAKVLIVDDDERLCDMLSQQVRRMGHDPVRAYTLSDGKEKIRNRACDVVFLDVNLPDGSGLDAIPEFQEGLSPPEIIIITGLGDPDGAELAIKNGAWDYIDKAASLKSVSLSLTRALQYREGKLGAVATVALKAESIVGRSPPMRNCLDKLAQASGSDASVIITGETGTGKELFAQAIHDNSSRAGGNFVVVDCTALPETLIESVLLGHEKGAFTGADAPSEGLIKQADGGTLFLDEIGDLSSSIQKVFLRVLQERRFRPVGSKTEIRSDFRLVAATNRDLEELVKKGVFRQDLLFRLGSLRVELPPLREHLRDMKPLVIHHVAALCERYDREMKGFSPEFFDSLASHDWPGNVRELVNTLDGAVTMAGTEPTLFCKHLPTHFRVRMARSSVSATGASCANARADVPVALESLQTLKEFRKTTEKHYIQDVVAAVGSDIKKACEVSGLSRSRLYDLLKEYGISISR